MATPYNLALDLILRVPSMSNIHSEIAISYIRNMVIYNSNRKAQVDL
jgi:hypothetical protein